jgi:hypothetical protein
MGMSDMHRLCRTKVLGLSRHCRCSLQERDAGADLIEPLKARGSKNDEVKVDELSVFPSRSGTLS